MRSVVSGKASRRICVWLATALSLLATARAADAQTLQLVRCPGGSTEPVTLSSGSWLLAWDCAIEGDLTLSGDATLLVVFAALTIRGDLRVSDDSRLFVAYSTLRMDNEFTGHRKIAATGRSLLYVGHSLVETNLRDQSNYFSFCEGRDSSVTILERSTLDTRHSWITARMLESAIIRVVDSVNLPRELFVQDSATAIVERVREQGSMAIWFSLPAGTSGEVFLPDQTTPYDWSFGRNSPEIDGVDYQLWVVDSWPSLAAVSRPGGNVTIRGRGVPETGELTIAYHVSGGTSVVEGLTAGLQDVVLDGGRLQLDNVHLGSTAWQIYCYLNDLLTVRNSVLNEVAAFDDGKVRVENSVLQLAFLGAAGENSRVSVYDSDIWSQTILSTHTGLLYVEASSIHGSVLQANDDATVHIVGSQLLPNGDGDPCTMSNAVAADGQPRCNPFLPHMTLPVERTRDNGQIIVEP